MAISSTFWVFVAYKDIHNNMDLFIYFACKTGWKIPLYYLFDPYEHVIADYRVFFASIKVCHCPFA